METSKERAQNDRVKGIFVDAVAYLVACGIGGLFFFHIDHLLVATAVFTATATLVLFLVSAFFSDVSVYDPYWSVAPPVMMVLVLLKYRIWNVNAAIVLILIAVWSVRLTANWLYTYRGLGHEDWRYRMYREKCSPVLFQLISFVGLHFVPTLVVYAGMISGFLAVQESAFSPWSVIGIAVMVGAVGLEYVSDHAIHGFLREHAGEHKTCAVSVWKYSRHPNYLGEMAFWTGLYLFFVAVRPDAWYMGLGFLSIIGLFLVVSIPMMERHNTERRADYPEYKRTTSMLLLLPKKGRKDQKTVK